MTVGIGPTPPISAPSTPRAPASTSNASSATSDPGTGEPELRIGAPRRAFREVMRETRGERPPETRAAPGVRASASSSGVGADAPVSRPSSPAGETESTSPLRATAVELMRDVARGERFVRSVMRRAARGADFSPQELLAIQAGVYRYTQELELVSKLVDKGTGAIRQTLQSQS